MLVGYQKYPGCALPFPVMKPGSSGVGEVPTACTPSNLFSFGRKIGGFTPVSYNCDKSRMLCYFTKTGSVPGYKISSVSQHGEHSWPKCMTQGFVYLVHDALTFTRLGNAHSAHVEYIRWEICKLRADGPSDRSTGLCRGWMHRLDRI